MQIRNRYKYSFIYLFISLLMLVITDPDNKIITDLPYIASIIIYIKIALGLILASTFYYISKSNLFDYKEADTQVLLRKAMETSQGAGLAIIGLGIIMLAVAIIMMSISHALF